VAVAKGNMVSSSVPGLVEEGRRVYTELWRQEGASLAQSEKTSSGVSG